MSYKRVKAYFDGTGLGERVVACEHIGDAVEHTAEAISCEPAHIVKTMSFVHKKSAALIVMSGDIEIGNPKYKVCFFQKIVMLPSTVSKTR